MLRHIIVLTLTCALLFSSGCSCLMPSPTPYGPKVTGDGTGGAIVVYEDIKSGNQRDFYAQKISPGGDILWGDEGVLIGSGYKEADSFFDLHIVSDGSGGAIIAWMASPSSQQREYTSHVTSVDSEGNIRWQREVKPFYIMISDGSGGVIIASISEEQKLSMLKVDSKGNYPWGEDGLPLYFGNYSSSLHMIGDGSGGAIIVQQNLTWTETNFEVFIQKVSSDGSLPWGQKGISLYPPSEEAEEVEIVNDGSGGAIVAWQMNVEKDIRVQRVDANGNVLWQQNGVPLGITKAAEEALPHTPLLVSDGSGGAIISWEDLRHGLASIYAQRLDADGNIKWQTGGEEVCYIKTNASFWPRTAVSDSSGGAIIACSYKEAETGKKGLLVQRLEATGRAVWGNGVMVTNSDHLTHFIASDGCGGAIVAWGSGKSMFKSERSYVQRIDSEGKLIWGAEGIRLNQ